MDQTVKTFTSEGADARGWIGRIIVAVILGEAVWNLIVSLMNNLLVPWLGDVMGQSSGLPTSFTQRPYNYPDFFVSVFEACIAGLVAAVLNYFFQRRRTVKVKSAVSSLPASPVIPSRVASPVIAPPVITATTARPATVMQPAILNQPDVSQSSVPQAKVAPAPLAPPLISAPPVAKPEPPIPAPVAAVPTTMPESVNKTPASASVVATPAAPASSPVAAKPLPPAPKVATARAEKGQRGLLQTSSERPCLSDED